MHYKAPDNSLHFIEPEYAHLLPTGSVPITEEEAEKLKPKHKPSITELRQSEYPPVTDFLDAYVKDDQVALKAYKEKCLAVKAKYPKEAKPKKKK